MLKELKPGDTLEGKYVIRKKIGEGGMGVVYRALHRDLEMTVAIKVLHPAEEDDPTMLDRFKIEAKSSASIKHPNVVDVSDYGLTPEGRPFFVMEFLEGESLADLLDRVQVLKPSQAVEIVDQILTGLTRAHKRNIIHRDLKPENIFLAKTEEGRRVVKILDFGIAKITRDVGGTRAIDSKAAQRPHVWREPGRNVTEHGVVMGTPGYMAPESLTGNPVDTRADLFAVGVLLFEMLTGRQPFRGRDAHEIMVNTATRPVPDIQKINPTLSDAIARLCLIALAKVPEDRFQTAEEFLAYLTAAAVGRIPEDGRLCCTDVASPSLIPKIAGDGIPLDLDALDTDSLRPRPVRPVARPVDPGALSAWDPNPPVQQMKRWKGTGPDVTYTGPPRRRRLIFPFSIFEVLFFLGVVGGAVYLVKTSSFFTTPLPVTEMPSPTFGSESERKIKAESSSRRSVTVQIWVDVAPADAEVFWNDEKKTERPFRVPQGDLPVRVEIRKEGYRSRTLVIVPNRQQTIHAVLEKETPARRKKR